MARGTHFDTESLVTGALQGLISKINERAEREQEKIKLQRDFATYVAKEKTRTALETQAKKQQMQDKANIDRDLFSTLRGGTDNQDFIKESPIGGIANLFGYDKSGNRTTGQVPYAMTEETETGRQPMMNQEVNMEAIGSAQTPTLNAQGVSMKPMSPYDKALTTYNQLKKIESTRPLNPGQQALKMGIEKKLFGVGEKDPSYTEGYRNAIQEGSERIRSGEKSDDVIRELRAKYPASMNYEREWTLKQIEKDSQKENAGLKNQAIKMLQDAKYPATEANIQAAIKQLRGR